jgi:geranylgeranylglycerol-phosphate geranylgeranyltransferase
MDAEGAIVYVFRTVGTALCSTTAALVAGFLILCLSPYRVSFDVGLLCAIILALALMTDLLMLPALILLNDRDHVVRPSNNTCIAALQLARPINCLMSALGILLGAWAVNRQLSWSALGLGMACGAFITAGGNTLNDYLDIEIDRRNHPQRPLPSGRIRPAFARVLSFLLLAAGILAGALAHPGCGALALLAVILLLAYEMAGLKQAGLPGNLIIGLLVGLLFMTGGALAGNVLIPVSLAVLAFFSAAGREIIKDIEDIAGDTCRKTWPMRVGVSRASAGVRVLFAGAMMLSPLPWLLGVLSSWYLPVAGLSLLLFLRSILILHRDPRAAGRTAKQAMIVVLTAFFVGVF